MQHLLHSRPARTRGAVLMLALMNPLLAGAAPPASKCKLMTVAQIPMDQSRLRSAISAAIDGHKAKMIVDTGGATSAIFRSAASAFGLKVVETGRKYYAAGGIEYSGWVDVRDFDVAGFMVHNLILTAMGHEQTSGDYAGFLGEDFLSHWDEEFDPAAGVMRLMVAKDCEGDQVVYWAPQYSVVHLIRSPSHHLKAEVQLNGHDVVALFDTGATNTLVTSEVAQRPGLRPTGETATGRQGHGLAPGTYDIDTAVFASITIGQETIQNPKLLVADVFSRDKEAKTGSLVASKPEWVPEMLIGADFFRVHRVYVARSQQKIYFTYLGGPIFQIPSRPAAQAQSAASPSADPPSFAAQTPGATPNPAPPPAGETPAPAAAK